MLPKLEKALVSGDIQLLQEGEASALESEVNLRAHFVAGVVEVVVLGICVQRLGWICEGDVNWICGQAALSLNICCCSPFCICLDRAAHRGLASLRFAMYL